MTSNAQSPAVLWFRQDLRLGDNPALTAAVQSGLPVLPVYVLDDVSAGQWAPGGASRWWLHQTLQSLDASLDGRLCILHGDASRLIPELCRRVGANAIYFNRCFEPWRVQRDAGIHALLAEDAIEVHQFDGSTLFDPDALLKADGTPYRVFTPFFRNACQAAPIPPRTPLPRPMHLNLVGSDQSLTVDQLDLVPEHDWWRSLAREWNVGEAAAERRLDEFLATGLAGYRHGRDRPDQRHVSRLSPHLHWGEISPNQVWHAVRSARHESDLEKDIDSFSSELGWREFSYYLLHHLPWLTELNLQKKFDRFPWQSDTSLLEMWQRGQTGYPIVDAGMRELWTTGYMHNRVRMIVGSFLVKNLLQDWRQGAAWFWDTLVDADLANNSASWQWVAGCGADAAPYFRIFNPVTQGKKFDPYGDYVRRFMPELDKVDDADIHQPWKEPVVELKASRQRALDTFLAL